MTRRDPTTGPFPVGASLGSELFILLIRGQVRMAFYLKTLPSAHSYVLPSTTIGLSQAHWSLTNSLSASLLGSSLVNV